MENLGDQDTTTGFTDVILSGGTEINYIFLIDIPYNDIKTNSLSISILTENNELILVSFGYSRTTWNVQVRIDYN